MKNTTITIHEGVATTEDGEQSKSIAFFVSLSSAERIDILHAAMVALDDDDFLNRWGMADDEFVRPLCHKVKEFMK